MKDKIQYKSSVKSIGIHFDEASSHSEVLSQVINKLSKAGFAPKKEIKEEWEMLLKLKHV